MPRTNKCGAQVELPDGPTLICGRATDHDGPVHDDNGHQWGDPDLPLPELDPNP